MPEDDDIAALKAELRKTQEELLAARAAAGGGAPPPAKAGGAPPALPDVVVDPSADLAFKEYVGLPTRNQLPEDQVWEKWAGTLVSRRTAEWWVERVQELAPATPEPASLTRMQLVGVLWSAWERSRPHSAGRQ
jgi:hypothetical protein